MKRALFLVWLVVIAGATTLPWSNYVGHSHWGHVRWIRFRDDPLKMGDLALNVILFMPFGFLLWQADHTVVSPVRMAVWTLVFSAILSLGGEFFQVYCHNRFPSATDVCTNILGAELGFLVRWWIEAKSANGSGSSVPRDR
jgi:hypothetical protein